MTCAERSCKGLVIAAQAIAKGEQPLDRAMMRLLDARPLLALQRNRSCDRATGRATQHKNSQSAARIWIVSSTVPILRRLCARAAAKRPAQHADVVPLLVQRLYSPHNAQKCRLPASCFTEGINEAAFHIRIRAATQFGLPAQVWTLSLCTETCFPARSIGMHHGTRLRRASAACPNARL